MKLKYAKNGLFLSNRRFKKGYFFEKSKFLFFVKLFLHTFCQKTGFFATRPPFLNRRLLINGYFFRKVIHFIW